MRIFLKLGGSVITDKHHEKTYLPDRVAPLGRAIRAALNDRPDTELVIGHGSGSFGHFAASKHRTAAGVSSPEGWRGYADVARTAAELNRLVADTLADEGLPVLPVQPSASAVCEDGVIQEMATGTLEAALAHGLIPLVHGDVALDHVRGGTIISTERVFFYLAPLLVPDHLFLLGNVSGVLDEAQQVIPRITPQTLADVESALGGSAGVDVTGGMTTKVHDMLRLAQAVPGLVVHVCSGLEPEAIRRALLNPQDAPGTTITGA